MSDQRPVFQMEIDASAPDFSEAERLLDLQKRTEETDKAFDELLSPRNSCWARLSKADLCEIFDVQESELPMPAPKEKLTNSISLANLYLIQHGSDRMKKAYSLLQRRTNEKGSVSEAMTSCLDKFKDAEMLSLQQVEIAQRAIAATDVISFLQVLAAGTTIL